MVEGSSFPDSPPTSSDTWSHYRRRFEGPDSGVHTLDTGPDSKTKGTDPGLSVQGWVHIQSGHHRGPRSSLWLTVRDTPGGVTTLQYTWPPTRRDTDTPVTGVRSGTVPRQSRGRTTAVTTTRGVVRAGRRRSGTFTIHWSTDDPCRGDGQWTGPGADRPVPRVQTRRVTPVGTPSTDSGPVVSNFCRDGTGDVRRVGHEWTDS